MAEDELAALWRHVAALHEAVVGLIERQRPPGDTATSPGELDALQQRLQALREEATARSQPTTAASPRLVELDVERLNVVEPDGTRRLVLSGKHRAPDPVVDGTTLVGVRQGGNPAGLIFYNDEGDECGGLVFRGRRQDGGYAAEAGLLFDQFRQDQVLGLVHGDADGERWAGLAVWDRPDAPQSERMAGWEAIRQMPAGPERAAAARAMGFDEVQRVFVGKTEDRSAVVRLCDGQRRVRLRLAVDAAGDASIEFLDEAGQVARKLTAATSEDGPPRRA